MTWYLYGSWWAWWLGGAFGYRGFIEYTALMAPPFATFIDLVRSWAPVRRLAAAATAVLLIFLNLRLSIIYYSPWDGPDWTWARLWSEIAKAFYLN